MNSTYIEIFGYIGSVLVVVSMLMSSVIKLRIINTIGSVISGTYALIIHSFPLALMNGCLVVINLINLYKLMKNDPDFDLVECKGDDSYMDYFFKNYEKDIKQYFPGFNKDKVKDSKVYVVSSKGNPFGVLVGKEKGSTFDIIIDYSTPTYRDCSVAKFLYKELANKGIKTLEFNELLSDAHRKYMEKMGYILNDKTYSKEL